MASLSEAQAAVEAQQQALQQAQQQAQQQKQETIARQQALPNVTSQMALRQTYQGVQGIQQRQNIQNLSNQLSQRISDINTYNKQLSDYNANVLTPYSQQLTDYQNQINSYNQQVKEYNQGYDWGSTKTFVYNMTPLQKQGYQDAINYINQSDFNTELQSKIDAVNAGSLTTEQAFGNNYNNLVKSGIIKVTPTPDASKVIDNLPQDVKVNFPSFNTTAPTYTNAFNQSLFPLVSAQTIQPTNLKGVTSNNLTYGLSGITGNTVGGLVSNNSGQSNVSSNSNFFSRLFDSASQVIEGGKVQSITGNEIYNPSLNAFGTVSALSQTAIFRPPTPSEQLQINQASQSGSFSNLLNMASPYFNFVTQNTLNTPIARLTPLAVQQIGKLLPPDQNPSYQQQYSQYVQQTPFTTLVNRGQLPAAVLKLGYEAGGFFGQVGTNIARGAGLPYPTSQTQQQQVNKELGQLLLFSGFSPLMKTGSYAQDVTTTGYEGIEEAYSNTIQSIRKRLAMAKTPEEQIKILQELSKKIDTTNPKAVENFKLFVQKLIETKSLNSKTIELLGGAVVRNEGLGISTNPLAENQFNKLTIDISGVPVNKGTGTITGLASKNELLPLVSAQTTPTQNQPTNLLNEVSKGQYYSLLKEAISTTQETKQSQKEFSLLGSVPTTLSLLGTAQQPQVKTSQKLQDFQISKSSQPQVSLFNQKTEQKTQQKTRQSSISLFKEKIKKKLRLGINLGESKLPKSNIERVSDLYNIYVKKKGKYSEIGKSATLKGASDILKRNLKSGLQASGYVTRNNLPIPAKYLGTNTEFKPSKRNPFSLVEQKGFRLSTKPERTEIQIAKRNSGNNLFKRRRRK